MSMDKLVRRETPVMSHQRHVYSETGELTRYQSSLLGTRYSILLRHPHSRHFCGYTLADPEDESLYGKHLAGFVVTFSDYGNRHICWREGHLVNEAGARRQIHRHQREDFWLGFDLMSRPETTNEEAILALQQFETAYWTQLNNA